MPVSPSQAAPGAFLRVLSPDDIPAAMELSSGAGWNQTPADWATLIELAPQSCFAIEMDGMVAATTTLVFYDRQLAWLGMVLTRPEYRGRGFARHLLEHALAVAERRGVATVKLDATDQGIRLYEKLGFRAEQVIERWSGESSGDATLAKTSCLTAKQMEELDHCAVGATRSPLLKLLSDRSSPISGEAGFAMHRPGRLAHFLGPCVSTSETGARQMIETCLAHHRGPWFWDLLPANEAAANMASEFGFRMSRSLVRMSRGAALSGNAGLAFATAGFELG